MGRHSAPETGADNDDRTVPILRIPQAGTAPVHRRPVRAAPVGDKPIRTMSGHQKQFAGVLFPIVDDLSMISADDELLDSIAAGRSDFGSVFPTTLRPASGPPFPRESVAAALEPLLVTWRYELSEAPLPETPRLPSLVRVMRAPVDRATRRSVKPVMAAAVAICALLLGSTAVGARSAEPGDTLWALSNVLYAGHADSVRAREDASRSLYSAGVLLGRGDAPKALVALTSASGQLERVELGADRERLQTTFDLLWVQAQTEASEAGSSSSADGRSTLAAVVAPGSASVGAATVPSSGHPRPVTSVRTKTLTRTTPSGSVRSTVPVVVVAPPTKGSTPGGRAAPVVPPSAPITTPPQHNSSPSVPVVTTHPVITPPPVGLTTPTASLPATSPPAPTVSTPPATSEPVSSDTSTAGTQTSTTSEMPSASTSGEPSDATAANGVASNGVATNGVAPNGGAPNVVAPNGAAPAGVTDTGG